MPSLCSFFVFLNCLTFLISAAPWPYIHIYPPVNTSDERTPLFFAVMLSTRYFQSMKALPGIQLALDYINNEPSILPEYTLHYTLSDSKCDPATTVKGVFQQLQESPIKLGWIGSGCLTATEFSTPLTQLYNMTQLSCVATSPDPHVDDRDQHRYYFQLRPTITILNRGLIGIIRRYNWKKVGLITCRDSYYSQIADNLKGLLSENSIAFSETLLPFDTINFSADLLDSDKRIYVLIVTSQQARLLLCQAFQRGLYYPTHQFLLIGEQDDEWLKETDPNRELGCTLEERRQTLNFALTVDIPNNAGDNVTVTAGGMTSTEFKEQVFRKATIPINEHLNLVDKIEGKFPTYSQLCHEATLALAMAIHNTSLDISSDRRLSQKAAKEAGMSEGEVFTLAKFSYANSAIVKRMFKHLNNTDFLGVTGTRVNFNSNGIRDIDTVMISQYTSQDGVYHRVGSVRVLNEEQDELQLQMNITEHLSWPSGIPHDGTPVQQMVTVSPGLTAIYTIFAAAGIIFAIACGIFNFIHRKKKLIRLSSHKLNYIIILGAMFFYISVIFLVLPSLDPDVIVVHCNLTPIIIFTGYSMCYGIILVKMFRVWYIFNHPTLHNKFVISDCNLLCIVLIFIGIDILITVTFITVQGLRRQLVASLTLSAENPQTIMGPTEVIQENYIYACDTEGRGVVIILLYISKILLQITSLILAFRTRKVKVKGLDDSKYISAAIYVTTIVLPIALFASLTLRSHVNAFPALVGGAHYFGATAILLLVFVPKMVGLYRDPTGEHVFQDQTTALGHNENSVMALRRDVQKLRVSLHLAQKKKINSSRSTDATEDDITGSHQLGTEMTTPHVHFNRSTTTVDNDYVQAVPQNVIKADNNIVVPAKTNAGLAGSSATIDIEQA